MGGGPIIDGNEIADNRGFGITFVQGTRLDLRNNKFSNNLGGNIDRP
jgi:parallel beta-helix repeat protein